MSSLVCIGECMVELSERSDGSLTRAFGGDTLNTALYLARLGVPVDYVSALGTDPFSDEMVSHWAAEGIGTGHVLRVPGRMPGLYLIRTDPGGERSFFYWRENAPVRQLFDLPGIGAVADAVCRAGTVYLSGITLSLFDRTSRERLFALLSRARSAGARIAFDTNFRPRGWPDRAEAQAAFDRAFALSDIVLAGIEDHGLLHGSHDPRDLAGRLSRAGVAEAVIKRGEAACHVISAHGTEIVAADPVADVIDTTAAGDSFAAAYLAARQAGRTPPDAARSGHRLAAAVIRTRGAIIPRHAMPAGPPGDAP